MYWIYCCRDKVVPKEFFYDGCQTDKDEYDRTPLMLWIEYRKKQDIPKELFYTGY